LDLATLNQIVYFDQEMSLSYIGEQFTGYGGYFILFTGIIGNGMNIIGFFERCVPIEQYHVHFIFLLDP
jgi:hypothetical protein